MHLPKRNRAVPVNTYPTLRHKLFPVIDLLEAKAHALGDSPTAQEVDDAGIRPLIRSLEPLLSGYRDSFQQKAFKRATDRLDDLVRLAGAYKDAAVIKKAIHQATGDLPPKIAARLSKSKQKRGREFTQLLRKMVKGELAEIRDTLFSVVPAKQEDLPNLVQRDHELMCSELRRLVAEVDREELLSSDLEHLHEGRKALRALLNAMNVAVGVIEFEPRDVEQITNAVDALGDIQNIVTARNWLKEKGFKDEAKQLAAYARTLEPGVRATVKQFLLTRSLERVACAIACTGR